MRRTQWRTVSCADGTVCEHSDRNSAYEWASQQERGAQYLVQFTRRNDWVEYARVTAFRPGWVKEELAKEVT